MKSIAIFVKNLTSGGAEKQAVLLARTLCSEYNVHFVIFNADKVHQKYMDMLVDEPRITIAGLKGNHIHRFKAFVAYIKGKEITQVYSYLTAANMYACLAKLFTGIKVVTGLRNAELPLGRRMADRLLTNTIADLTIANCYSGRDNFTKQGFRKSKIIIIPNCFENITEYKEKRDTDCPTIITVGRFVPQKDYETAIKSISILNGKGIGFKFQIIGYGEYESDVRQWVKTYHVEDVTEILINPDNIPEYLGKADIYLSTSLFEGTSNSIMEGMNADLPIVCTKVGDNEYLVRDGINGIITQKQDTEAIANGLERLICDAALRRQMGKEGKEHLKKNYSTTIIKWNYSKVIEGL